MISGFTFVKNAIDLDYPIREAILSILPLCDEVVVAVGQSSDETLAHIEDIGSPKIRIINTVWDESLREGGHVLAVETDKALAALHPDTRWAIYIQGDEVLHEDGHADIKEMMHHYQEDEQVEALLLRYHHFYGSYDYIAASRDWYRREIRILKPHKGLSSYKDAQGFRINDRKIRVKLCDAYMHHYGWVKHPETQQNKQRSFNKLWHTDDYVSMKVGDEALFDYSSIDSLELFTGRHPMVMQERVDKMNWRFSFDPSQKRLSMKKRLLSFIEKQTGYRIGEYRNYKMV